MGKIKTIFAYIGVALVGLYILMIILLEMMSIAFSFSMAVLKRKR